MGNRKERQPLRLLWVFVFGFIFSLAVVAGFFLLFAAQAAGRWDYWAVEPRLDQDLLFGVARNAVTLAAALGVGITLFFSYRKQQTTEQAQALSVQAQETATKAQDLATKTLQLSLDKHELEKVGVLRDRYSRSAEQIASIQTAVQLAGIHSLAALADDWAALGDHDEQQVCIALLCSYISLNGSMGLDPTGTTTTTAVNIALARLTKNDEHPEKFWGNRKISIDHADIRTLPKEVTISGGNLDFVGCTAAPRSTFYKLEIDSGNLSFVQAAGDLTIPSFDQSSFNGGMVLLHGPKRSGSEFFQFTNCVFDGSTVVIFPEREGNVSLVFEKCAFISGKVSAVLYVGHYNVEFKGCTFNSTEAIVIDRLYADAVDASFNNCQFVGEATAMQNDPGAFVLSAPKKQRGSNHSAAANKT